MKKIFFLGLVTSLMLSGAVWATDNTGSDAPTAVACTMDYNPVCGVDGKTYGNTCMAAGAGVKVAAKGECGQVAQPVQPTIDLKNCQYYFDGCNNCSVSDGKVAACTRMYCEIKAPAKCIKYKDDAKPTSTTPSVVKVEANCTLWYDGCNDCMVKDGKVGGCTKRMCVRQAETKCLKYKETVGVDNNLVLQQEIKALRERVAKLESDKVKLQTMLEKLFKISEDNSRRINELSQKIK